MEIIIEHIEYMEMCMENAIFLRAVRMELPCENQCMSNLHVIKYKYLFGMNTRSGWII